jgi:hypothetical protein
VPNLYAETSKIAMVALDEGRNRGSRLNLASSRLRSPMTERQREGAGANLVMTP